MITRRSLLVAGAGGLLTGCDAIGRAPATQNALRSAEAMHQALHRAIVGDALAHEYRPDQMSPNFRTNGTSRPNTLEYEALLAGNFADWRLTVDGLVARPLSLSLQDLAAMPQRVQITRHDCVEGWSAIGKWQGPRLASVLAAAGLRDAARFLVFHCADRMGDGAVYYESIGLADALHPQTILAWAMNGQRLPVGHGAPVRLRVERQLGYKHAKYVMRMEAVASLAGIGKGKGGYWEDASGYQWYAGI
jgi:DMSO/TMAO reductase YedYZ molybdopterin-dependent catalytic subunit